jgi:hypothetical protein
MIIFTIRLTIFTYCNLAKIINYADRREAKKRILYIKWDVVYQVNNSVIFSGKHIGSEEFLNQMVEALGIILDGRPKEKKTS